MVRYYISMQYDNMIADDKSIQIHKENNRNHTITIDTEDMDLIKYIDRIGKMSGTATLTAKVPKLIKSSFKWIDKKTMRLFDAFIDKIQIINSKKVRIDIKYSKSI